MLDCVYLHVCVQCQGAVYWRPQNIPHDIATSSSIASVNEYDQQCVTAGQIITPNTTLQC